MKNIFLFLTRAALLLSLVTMVACGLQPAYQYDKANKKFKNTILQEIAIDPIKSREGQILVNELDYAFGARRKSFAMPKGLRASISITDNNIGDVSASNVNQVQEIIVRVHFILYEKPSGKVLNQFHISKNSTNIVVSLSGFTQNEVRKQKLEFAMKSIALDARNRLLLYQEK